MRERRLKAGGAIVSDRSTSLLQLKGLWKAAAGQDLDVSESASKLGREESGGDVLSQGTRAASNSHRRQRRSCHFLKVKMRRDCLHI